MNFTDALIIWLGNNSIASGVLSAICAFLMLVGLITCIRFGLNLLRNYKVEREYKKYFKKEVK